MAQGSAISSSIEDDEGLEDAEVVLDDELVVDEPDAEQAELEARARLQGWRPQAEFRGTPGTWIGAKAFLEKGENFVPFLRKDLKEARAHIARLTSEVEGIRSDYAEQSTILKEMRDFARNADQAGYNRAMAELKAKQRAAVTEGDTAAFDEVTEQIEELEDARADRKQPPPPPPERPQPQPKVAMEPEVQAFIAANPWFTRDEALNQAMQKAHVRLKESNPELSLAENLEAAKADVMARFPEEFPNERQPQQEPRPRSRVVLPPRQQAPQQRRSVGFDSITDPVDREAAKKEYARQKRHMPDFTVEEYLTLYNNPRADVIAMRHAKKGGR